jgi:hypothetical protein
LDFFWQYTGTIFLGEQAMINPPKMERNMVYYADKMERELVKIWFGPGFLFPHGRNLPRTHVPTYFLLLLEINCEERN